LSTNIMSLSFNMYWQSQLRQFNSDYRKIGSLRRGRSLDSGRHKASLTNI